MTAERASLSRAAVAARDLARLVLPVECPGCRRPDEILCEVCAATLSRPVRRCEQDVPRLDKMDGWPPLPVWTVTTYTGPVRGVVVAWKDRGRRDLTARLVAAARRAGEEAAPALGGRTWASGAASDAAPGRAGGPSGAPLWTGSLHVVPVPSTPAARRRRGADLVRLLAAGVTEGLTASGVPALTAPVLRRRAAADQVGLGARARGGNTRGIALRRQVDVCGRWHVLVDDVVTTGSTLAACCRALEAAGGLVLGAVVLAATPSPTRR